MATFITSKLTGETIGIYVETSTGYWKYNHDGSDSSVFNQNDESPTITVANANGEFTIISCDVDGILSGDITQLQLDNNQLTSFDGTGLSGLTQLGLGNNQLTSLSGFTFPSSLTNLNLAENQLTSFDGTGLSGLTVLQLGNNQLTSFDGTGLSGLTGLQLSNNQLTSVDVTGLSSLTNLQLGNNQLTTFDGTGLSSLTGLNLINNQLTSFDGTGLTSLTFLNLNNNPLTTFIGGDMGQITDLNFQDNWNITTLTSFDGGNMVGLTELYLYGNQLTSFDGTGLSSLTSLQLGNNQLTPTANNQILNQLNQHGLSGGNFQSSNGRTSASNTDYDNLLNNLGWTLSGLDLVTPLVTGNGKLRVKGFTSGGGTPPSSNYTFNPALSTYFEAFTFNVVHEGPGKNDDYTSTIIATATVKPSWYNTYPGGPTMTLYYATPSDIANNINGHAMYGYASDFNTTVSTNVYSNANAPLSFTTYDPQNIPLNAPTPVSGLTFRVVIASVIDLGTVLEEFLITF
jgi:Leucine-rich repeat (LRR) protein